jgi:hypothetical protein
MSRHYCDTTMQGQPVRVVLGYDRPLDYVFCTVQGEEGDIVYSNLEDEGAGTHQQDVDYFRSVLAGLQIQVPMEMFIEVAKDQLGCVGNRVVQHRVSEDAP